MNSLKFAAKPFYKSLIEGIDKVCKENNVDSTHGLAHAMKIGRLTEKAVETETTMNEKDVEDVILAAYLHDIDDRKYFTTENCENAVRVLKELNISKESIKKIIQMIELVSFAKNGNTINQSYPMAYYFPRYIDRSEAIGIEGLYRSYLYNKESLPKRPTFIQSTPRPKTEAEAVAMGEGRDVQYMKNGQSASLVDHFFDKLIHLALPSQMTNPFMKQLYDEKKKEMIEFVIENAKTGYVEYETNLMEANKKIQIREAQLI